MPEQKTMKITALKDIIYGGKSYKKDSDSFDVPYKLGKRLVDSKAAKKSK